MSVLPPGVKACSEIITSSPLAFLVKTSKRGCRLGYCNPWKMTRQLTLWGTSGVVLFRRDSPVNHEEGSLKAMSKK